MGRQPCCEKIGLKRGPWTAEEDKKLMNFILTNGQHCWRLVPKLAGLQRCGKSCRLRWTNYLRPDLKRGAFSEAEENQIIELHARLGNRWSKIAAHFSGRTDNEIKNHWNTRIKKRLKLLGLDPQTHKPINNSDTSYDMPAGKEEEGETDAMEKSTFSSSQNYVGGDVAVDANDIGKESEIELDDTAAFWQRYNMLWETQLDSNHVNETSNSSAYVATLSSSATTAMATATTPPPLPLPSVAATAAECFAFPRENSSSILDELRPLWDERIDYFRVWDGVQFLDGIL